MPQLLSSILHSDRWRIEFDAGVLHREPELAALVGESVAKWAAIEHSLGNILVEILGSHITPGLAMFSVLTSASAQLDTIKAAANVTLQGEALDAFHATINVVQSAQKQRNRLVHWLWGQSPQVPNALLLTDPTYIRNKRVEVDQFHREDARQRVAEMSREEMRELHAFDHTKIYVYRKGDLERINRDLDEARAITGTLIWYLDEPRFGMPSRDLDENSNSS
jgi:hypothetical protein